MNLQGNLDIYITWSNGCFMSGELATLLAGRYVELKILSLSFREFASTKKEMQLTEIYDLYKQTALPYLAEVAHEEERFV